MIEYINIALCIGSLATAFAAIVQVAASARAFANITYRVLGIAALIIWMLHGFLSAVAIVEGGYLSTLWTALHWFANLSISLVIVKILSRFEMLDIDEPNKAPLFAAKKS